MGWWWSSAEEAETQSTPTPKQTDTKSTIPSSQTTSPSPDTATVTPRTLTRDEQADADLQSFLRELQSDTQSTSTPDAASSTSTSSPLSPTSIAPSSLYPTTISCRAALDSAFYCQSVGGQFMNLYRYGSMRDCSDQWSNLWFCMRTNRGMMSEEERMRRVQDHYRQRAVKYKIGPSSEDVWEVRMERVEGAFEGDLERLEREEVERKRQEAGV